MSECNGPDCTHDSHNEPVVEELKPKVASVSGSPLKGFRAAKQPSKRQVIENANKAMHSFEERLQHCNDMVTGLYKALTMLAGDRQKVDQQNGSTILLQGFQLAGIINLLLDKGIVSANDIESYVRKENSNYMQAIEADIDAEMGIHEVDAEVTQDSVVSVRYTTTDQHGLNVAVLSFDWNQIVMNEPIMFEELRTNLLGMKAGKENRKRFTFTIPEDSNMTHLSGELTCEVEVLKVKAKTEK